MSYSVDSFCANHECDVVPSLEANASATANTRKRKRTTGAKVNRNTLKLSTLQFNLSDDSGSLITACAHIFLDQGLIPLSYISTKKKIDQRTVPRFLYLADEIILKFLRVSNTRQASQVVVVTFDSGDCLYALEHVEDRVFAVCPLQERITLSSIQALATRATHVKHPCYTTKSCIIEKDNWWKPATCTSVASQGRAKLTSPSLCEPNASDNVQACAESEPCAVVGSQERVGPKTSETISTFEQNVVCKETKLPTEIHADIVQNYMESLYHSKASLAYFSKGPLSRARVASTSEVSQSTDHNHLKALSENLRTMVLKTTLLDKKYRESLPEIVKNGLKRESCADHRAEGLDSERRKPRKKRKPKPGKDGLYADEQDYIVQWLLNAEDESSAKDYSTAFDSRIAQLKTRESYLQLVLLLEITALERSLPQNVAEKVESSEGKVVSESTENSSKDNRSAKKRKMGSEPQLDMLVDRLCIWQSVNAEAETRDDGDQAEHPIFTHEAATPEPSKSKDHLKEFCLEVVIPLYGSRLPDVVVRMASKIGIKYDTSPMKHASTRSKPSKVAPGTEIVRARPTKAKSKALSKSKGVEQAPKGFPQPLLRSATDSQLYDTAREKSATPFSADALKQHRRSISRSNSISQPKQIAQREINMNAIKKYNESRSKVKEKSTEHELKMAIAALKKPNRGLAVKDYVEAVDQSRSAKSIRSNKNLPSSGRRSKLPIEVNATPKHNKRSKLDIVTTPHRHDSQFSFHDSPIPSTIPLVPSSSAKSRTNATQHLFLTPAKPSLPPTTLQTPPLHQPSSLKDTLPRSSNAISTSIRESFHSRSPGCSEPNSDLITSKADLLSGTSTCPVSSPDLPVTQKRNPLASTSLNQKSVSPERIKIAGEDCSIHETPKLSAHAEISEETPASIYDSLGWNYEEY